MIAHALVDLDLSPEETQIVGNFGNLAQSVASPKHGRHKLERVAIWLADVTHDGGIGHQLPATDLLLALRVGRDDAHVANSPTELGGDILGRDCGFGRKFELDAKVEPIRHLDGTKGSHGPKLLEAVDGRPRGADARQGGGVLVEESRAAAASHSDAAGNGAVHGLPGGEAHDGPLLSSIIDGICGLGWDGGGALVLTGLEGGAEIEDDQGNHVGRLGRRDVHKEGNVVVLAERARSVQRSLPVGEAAVGIADGDLVAAHGTS